ncbi:aldose 1-epimerase family protein [Agreia sp. COWG]|uniref:aldose 1-epimerase family protein n=1 Tax=Agreia sp. COWG TaxID=2773266 RepID=UPI001928FC38|nr:aldose 1-epimerase family protein [Agreia sp. COWG]CAD6001420.1 Galactose mutarotase [Agreia sp. COWG]
MNPASTVTGGPLSGAAYSLSFGDYTADIAGVGASLRTLRHSGRDLVVPFDEDEVRPAFRGAVLAPWPNRVVDGRYEFGGELLELALTEPRRGHALHGLAAWGEWQLVESGPAHVTLSFRVEAQAGYPFRIDLTVRYELTDGGLVTTVSATNSGSSPAPYGTGPHPYLVAGPGRVDDWSLQLPARAVLTVTPDRLIPVDLADVELEDDGAFDFVAARPIDSTFIDHAFTELERDADSVATVLVTSPQGTGVGVSWGTECQWVQIHTADQPDEATSRLGLAVEPMTCPPDAFNTGTDLVVLDPGEQHHASWTIFGL